MALVYNYGSQLEKDSPRFNQPGDFFVYIAFVSVVILVSRSPALSLLVQRLRTSHICPHSHCSSCSGSWKRGRLPLYFAWARHSQSIQRVHVRCKHGGTD